MENITERVNEANTPDRGTLLLLDVIHESLVTYVMPVVLLVGVVGNTFSVLIFTRRRNNDRASSTYLLTLSLVDIMNLCLGIHVNIFSLGLVDHLATSRIGCKFRMYFMWVGFHLSAWILVVFTIERSLVIMFPLRMKTAFDSGKGRRVALGLLFGITLCLYIYYPFDTEMVWRGGKAYCLPQKNMSQTLSYLADFVEIGLCYLTPMVCIPIGNIIILQGLRKNRIRDDDKTRQQSVRMLRNLLLVTCVQFIGNGPQTCILIYRALTGGRGTGALELKILYLTSLVVRTSFCINPCLYIFSLDYYRNELRRVLCPCWKKKPKVVDNTKTTLTDDISETETK